MTRLRRRPLWPTALLALLGPVVGLVAYWAGARGERESVLAYLPVTGEDHAVTLGIEVFLGYELVLGLLLVSQAWVREKQLRLHNELMGSVIQSVPDGVVVADTDGRFLAVNEAARRIVGGSRNRAVSRHEWSDVYGLYVPGTDRLYPSEELPLARAIRGEEVPETEIEIRNDRLSFSGWASVTGAPIRDSRGRLLGGVAVFRDVTERKRADELSQWLYNAVEQTADSVMITDRTGVIQYVNPAFEETTGYSRAEAVGATPRLLRSGKQSPAYYQELWAAILAGRAYKATVVNRRKSGEHFFVEQTITPMRDRTTHEITHFVSVMRDLTDRLKVEEQGAELSLAASIQQRLFPRHPPQIPGYDVAGAFSPALATCGDYFDFLQVPGDRLVLAVADVCGHGLGPGLIMAATRGYLRSLAQAGLPLAEVTEGLNRLLLEDLNDHHFVTMLVGSLDIPSGTLTWANMGHPSGFVLDASGAVKTTLRSTCKPLGLFPDLGRSLGEPTVVEPGDTVVLLTDGVLEAESPGGVEHGTDGALSAVRANLARPAAEIVAGVIAAARSHAAGAAQEDDITAVVVKRTAI